mgnify:CR=1 FL=1
MGSGALAPACVTSLDALPTVVLLHGTSPTLPWCGLQATAQHDPPIIMLLMLLHVSLQVRRTCLSGAMTPLLF